jgi:hypothetical protein
MATKRNLIPGYHKLFIKLLGRYKFFYGHGSNKKLPIPWVCFWELLLKITIVILNF